MDGINRSTGVQTILPIDPPHAIIAAVLALLFPGE